MADLDDRLRALDEAGAPDLWDAISSGQPVPHGHPRSGEPASPLRRIVAAAAAIALAGAATWLLVLAFGGRGGHARPDRPGARFGEEISVAGVVDGGALECTATAPSSVVQPGAPTGVVFVIENVSEKRREYTPGIDGDLGFLVVENAQGEELADTSDRLGGIIGAVPMRRDLAPGEKASLMTLDTAVLWPGPLTVHPVCMREELPPLTLDVVVPGPAPSAGDAVRRAVKAAHGLFDSCLPPADGSEVEGLIEAPEGSDAPRMTARCSASVEVQEGFAVVALRFVAPSDAQVIDWALVEEPWGFDQLPKDETIEALVWRFVVTEDVVREARGPQTVHRTLPFDAMAPDFEFFDGAWHEGASRCGAVGTGGVLFISACPPKG